MNLNVIDIFTTIYLDETILVKSWALNMWLYCLIIEN